MTSNCLIPIGSLLIPNVKVPDELSTKYTHQARLKMLWHDTVLVFESKILLPSKGSSLAL